MFRPKKIWGRFFFQILKTLVCFFSVWGRGLLIFQTCMHEQRGLELNLASGTRCLLSSLPISLPLRKAGSGWRVRVHLRDVWDWSPTDPLSAHFSCCKTKICSLIHRHGETGIIKDRLRSGRLWICVTYAVEDLVLLQWIHPDVGSVGSL
jgi:hypothetical protein